MRPIVRALLIASALHTGSIPGTAQSTDSWFGSVGLIGAGDVALIDMAAGADARWRRLIGAASVGLSMYSGEEDSRYYTDTFSNGQSRCRDSKTGQFASNSMCSAGEIAPLISAELMVDLTPQRTSAGWSLGAGLRGGEATGGYGVLAYAFDGWRDLRGSVVRVYAGSGHVGASWLLHFGRVSAQ